MNPNSVHSIRLKKINPTSQSWRAHLFFGLRLIQQNSRFEFFCLLNFFFQFFMNLLVKIYKKRYDRHNETLWTIHFYNSVFYLGSSSSKIKFHISKLRPTQILPICCSEKKKKKHIKKPHLGQVFQSVASFETQHLFFLALSTEVRSSLNSDYIDKV